MFIIASQGSSDPTRAIGLLAYSVAFLCCCLASIRMRLQRHPAGLVAMLAFTDSALLMDMALNWRWKLHQSLITFTTQKHEYDQRRTPQFLMLVLLGGLLFAGFVLSWRFLRGKRAAFLATSGVMLSVTSWCTEVVSLHAVDHILYTSIGGVMAVSFLWVLSCLMTALGVLLIPR